MIFQYNHLPCVILTSRVISPDDHLSKVILEPLPAWNCCCNATISFEIIPYRNHCHPIISCKCPKAWNRGGAFCTADAIVIVPWPCTLSTMQSIKSGSVSASSNHCFNAQDDCINASTLPTSGHSMTCSAVSTWIV
jgi:hypothetical protein